MIKRLFDIVASFFGIILLSPVLLTITVLIKIWMPGSVLFRQILELRPGITRPVTLLSANEEEILASVSDPLRYNDDVLWPDKVRINLEYYYKHSFAGDLKIILQTIFRG